MPWILSKEFRFEAAHYLPHHDGRCRNLHGHSFKGTVYICGEKLIDSGSKQGMVIDYSEIKQYLAPIVEDFLDHHYLNETLGLENPTSEAIAQWIYDRLESDGLPGIVGVLIEETCTSKCFYTRSDRSSSILSDALIVG